MLDCFLAFVTSRACNDSNRRNFRVYFFKIRMSEIKTFEIADGKQQSPKKRRRNQGNS